MIISLFVFLEHFLEDKIFSQTIDPTLKRLSDKYGLYGTDIDTAFANASKGQCRKLCYETLCGTFITRGFCASKIVGHSLVRC